MIDITDEGFNEIVTNAIDAIPERYARHIANVAFIVEDEPNAQQRQELGLRCNQSLYGLYQGVPLPQRGGVAPLLPDKITVFKHPTLMSCHSESEVQESVNHTIWHEVAHYFGLNHSRIHDLESKEIANG